MHIIVLVLSKAPTKDVVNKGICPLAVSLVKSQISTIVDWVIRDLMPIPGDGDLLCDYSGTNLLNWWSKKCFLSIRMTRKTC